MVLMEPDAHKGKYKFFSAHTFNLYLLDRFEVARPGVTISKPVLKCKIFVKNEKRRRLQAALRLETRPVKFGT
jgi:hypothetical protein